MGTPHFIGCLFEVEPTKGKWFCQIVKPGDGIFGYDVVSTTFGTSKDNALIKAMGFAGIKEVAGPARQSSAYPEPSLLPGPSQIQMDLFGPKGLKEALVECERAIASLIRTIQHGR